MSRSNWEKQTAMSRSNWENESKSEKDRQSAASGCVSNVLLVPYALRCILHTSTSCLQYNMPCSMPRLAFGLQHSHVTILSVKLTHRCSYIGITSDCFIIVLRRFTFTLTQNLWWWKPEMTQRSSKDRLEDI